MRWLVVAAGFCCLAALGWIGPDDKKDAVAKMICLDLQRLGNENLKREGGNDLSELPAGEQKLEGVKFKIGDKLIQLGSKMLQGKPVKVEGIKVGQKFAKLHILHACQHAAEQDTIIGEYTVTWDDDTSVTIPITYGKDVLDWWFYENSPEPSRGKVAWKGNNEAAKGNNAQIRLYLTTWENTKPDKKVKAIDFSSTNETPAAPFCVAMTVEGK
jgi:hypothetical protein